MIKIAVPDIMAHRIFRNASDDTLGLDALFIC
jgi:hypothetical protein